MEVCKLSYFFLRVGFFYSSEYSYDNNKNPTNSYDFLSRQFQMFSNIYSKELHNEEKKHFFKVVERALLNRLL